MLGVLTSSLGLSGECHSLSFKSPSQDTASTLDDDARTLVTRSDGVLEVSVVVSLHHVEITGVDDSCLDLDKDLS